MKKQYPDRTVVAYVNTTATLKEHCDVCVTSSSAVEIVSKINNDKILFIPDPNLGAYVAEKLPQKDIKTVNGHSRVSNGRGSGGGEKASSRRTFVGSSGMSAGGC